MQELGYLWFEAPISDSDHEGLRHLRRYLSVPIAGAESVVQGLRAYPPFLTGNLVDALRSVGDQSGGITAMRKTAAMCEAFNIKYEPHSYGTTTIQAAHLHVMLSIFHCDFVELPVPRGVWDFAMYDSIWIDYRGHRYDCGPRSRGGHGRTSPSNPTDRPDGSAGGDRRSRCLARF